MGAPTSVVLASQGGGGGGSLTYKESVRAATAAPLPSYSRTDNVITAAANGQLADVDGVTLDPDDSFLLQNGASPVDNGIYTVTTLGDGSTPFVLTRRTDSSASAQVPPGMRVSVGPEGTVYGSKELVLTTPGPITLNTSALTFADPLNGIVPASSALYIPTSLIRIAGPGDGNTPLNDWTPSQWTTEEHYIISGDGAPITITGFANTVPGPKTFTWITNANLTLAHSSASSAIGNRIQCPGGVDLVVPQYGSFIIGRATTGGNTWKVLATSF